MTLVNTILNNILEKLNNDIRNFYCRIKYNDVMDERVAIFHRSPIYE